MIRIISFLVSTVLLLFLGGCLETIEIGQEPRHFTVKDTDEEMMISLTWKVNGHDDGHNFLDLDLYISDTSRLTEESFILAAAYPSYDDWRDQPVLLFSVGSRNSTETIFPSRYEHDLDDFRKYVGIAINGLGEKYASLTGPVVVDYEVRITLQEKIEIISGSFTYSSGWLNKTAVKYIASVDIDGLDNVYSFRVLAQELWVIRNSDFVFTNQIDVSASGWRTQQNDRLVVRLDWSVNNTSPGYEHIDMDLISGTSLPGSITGRSESEDDYERINFNTFEAVDFQREIGHKFFENLRPNAGAVTIQYTYSVYFNDNPFYRFVKSGSITSPPTNTGSTIYKTLSFSKVGDVVTVSP